MLLQDGTSGLESDERRATSDERAVRGFVGLGGVGADKRARKRWRVWDCGTVGDLRLGQLLASRNFTSTTVVR